MSGRHISHYYQTRKRNHFINIDFIKAWGHEMKKTTSNNISIITGGF